MESKTFILSNELYDQYTNKAKEYAGLWGIDDAHVIQIMTSIMLHRDGLRKGGGFVEAVVNNNLRQAVGRADDTVYKHLKVIVATVQHCHI